VKEVLRRVASRLIVGSGISVLGRRIFPKKGAVILMGHRVRDDEEGFLQGLKPQWFKEQVAYLARNYEPISLSFLVECFEKGEQPPDNSVVLTFDDGFRDNLENAFPVLRDFAVPVTIFLVTGCIDRGELPWPQRLGFLLQTSHQWEVSLPWDRERRLPLDSKMNRLQAFQILSRGLERHTASEVERHLGRLSNDLKVEPPRDRMLNWDEAREMQATGLVEFGAHTVNHPWMEHLSLGEARWELETSKEALLQHLGVERPPFAFPGGSFNATLVEMVKSLGFRSVFQSRPDLRINSPAATDQFALSRVGLPNAPAFILEAELDGPLHPIRRIYRRGR